MRVIRNPKAMPVSKSEQEAEPDSASAVIETTPLAPSDPAPGPEINLENNPKISPIPNTDATPHGTPNETDQVAQPTQHPLAPGPVLPTATAPGGSIPHPPVSCSPLFLQFMRVRCKLTQEIPYTEFDEKRSVLPKHYRFIRPCPWKKAEPDMQCINCTFCEIDKNLGPNHPTYGRAIPIWEDDADEITDRLIEKGRIRL